MNYKIHTEPIIEVYATACSCPLCVLERNLEARLIELYLGEAVMTPEYRVDVNKDGFCRRHFDMLREGDNILGLALQMKTRNEWIRDRLVRPTDSKSALKESVRLQKTHASCVICKSVEEHMKRYYETAAAIFGLEPGFEAVLRRTKGHCMKHYQALLPYSKYAGARAERYLDVLYNLQLASLQQLDGELQCFIDQFDSQKQTKAPANACDDIIAATTEKLSNF